MSQMSQPFKGTRLQIPGEHDGVIHVSKRAYGGIIRDRKIDIISICSVGGVGGKVVIEYVSKRGRARGCMELNDLGPQPNKSIKG